MKTVDLLNEDQPINGQKFALISIVGPNLKQKCNIYGIKIRGVADTVDKAKQMTKRIMQYDNDYDIYTVEIGKFFPLDVDPMEIQDIEYQNEQLNTLVKSYLENRQQANDHYEQRKNDLRKKAIQEGTKEGQAELAERKEHPISVLQRKQAYEEKLKELQDEIDTLGKDLELTTIKYDSYSEEERTVARLEIENATKEPSTDELKNPVENTLDELKLIENQIQELNNKIDETDETNSPNVYTQLLTQRTTLVESLDSLKEKLNDKTTVNDYINKSYSGKSSEFDTIFN
jgi:DNA repair exonuclease SbcCD ATPase subunit